MLKLRFLITACIFLLFPILYYYNLSKTSDDAVEPTVVATPHGNEDVLTMEKYIYIGEVIVYGSNRQGSKAIGRGQCPLCHSFMEGEPDGRGPNLFGIEKLSHSRIKEDHYLNHPIKVGEEDPKTGVIKGKPDQVNKKYRRQGSAQLTGEDYLRESLMCPDCYIVGGFAKGDGKKSAMPVITEPPIILNSFQLNAVIAWMQFKDDKDLSKVTIPLPDGYPEIEEPKMADWHFPELVDENAPIEELIYTLGCPLCHVIPGVKGAVHGILGPPLYLKTNGPIRLQDKNYKGTAKNVREYIEESIVNPEIYIASNEEVGEPYPEGIEPLFYKVQIPPKSLSRLVDFLANTEAPEGTN
jgi:hypothetical protein